MTLDREDITAIASEVAAMLRHILAVAAPPDAADSESEDGVAIRSQAAQDLAAARERKALRQANKADREGRL